MRLTVQESYELLRRHGVYAREICDKCGVVLCAFRFTRKDESGVWCSRECRGDAERRVTRKGGRPRKYATKDARRSVELLQSAERQRKFRGRVQRNGKLPRTTPETKDLQVQKAPLSTIPLAPLFPAQETSDRENGGARVSVMPTEAKSGTPRSAGIQPEVQSWIDNVIVPILVREYLASEKNRSTSSPVSGADKSKGPELF
jgi:hypothetical protein